jgi:GAF domain-containing protein
MTNTEQGYQRLSAQAKGLLSGQKHRIANAANLAALLFQELQDISWVGFYFLEEDELVLGPFQGRPACTSIPWGQGVCGTAAATGITQCVEDVHTFEGHIACDSASNSEIVIPLFRQGQVIGVLDLDSVSHGRFKPVDQRGLEAIARIYLESIT